MKRLLLILVLIISCNPVQDDPKNDGPQIIAFLPYISVSVIDSVWYPENYGMSNVILECNTVIPFCLKNDTIYKNDTLENDVKFLVPIFIDLKGMYGGTIFDYVCSPETTVTKDVWTIGNLIDTYTISSVDTNSIQIEFCGQNATILKDQSKSFTVYGSDSIYSSGKYLGSVADRISYSFKYYGILPMIDNPL